MQGLVINYFVDCSVNNYFKREEFLRLFTIFLILSVFLPFSLPPLDIATDVLYKVSITEIL